MKNELRLGRLVQCRCAHTCLPNSNHGFQWLLPRTKSKHMLYQQVQQKNIKNYTEKTTSLEQLQQQLSSLLTLNDSSITTKGRITKTKKRRTSTFKIPILLENELKKTIASSENNVVLKEFFVKTSYN